MNFDTAIFFVIQPQVGDVKATVRKLGGFRI